ncbi:MAG: hypothetical protein D6763_10840 [Alphaproteobacteria bacterium]|nr:MAG: hypothetical protein D6763_10840 [Alphaproteobacteria bacterium]
MSPSPDTPDNTHNPVVTLISLTRRLAEIIATENRHLEARRPDEAKKLHDEKGRLSAAYAREMEIVRKNGGITAFGSAEQLRELKRQTANFQRLLDDHRRLVERSRAITEGILKAIGDEVARRNRPATGYGKNAVPPRQRFTPPTSLTLNQII